MLAHPSGMGGGTTWSEPMDGQTVRLYVDGQEIGTGTTLPTPTAIVYDLQVTDFLIGVNADESTCAYRFNGVIAEVRIWNGVLSPDEILMRANGEELA